MRTIIKETLEKLHIPTKEFTQQLKKLEKECGGRYRIRLEKETEKVVLAMEIFLTSTQLGIDVAYVKEMVYNSNPDIRLGHKEYLTEWMTMFQEHNIDPSQNILDLIIDCRNHFPHKSMNGQSPKEVMLTM